jgi:hypothetical protein
VTSLCNTGILRHSLVGGSKESSTCEHLWASVSWKKKMRYPITPNCWTPCRTLPDLAGPCRTLPDLACFRSDSSIFSRVAGTCQ